MDGTLKFPFYAKFAFVVIGAFALVCSMYIGQQILLPIIYSIIIAILLSPVVNYLERKKINRAVAIAIVLATCIIVIAGLVALLSSQANKLVDAWPQLTSKFQQLFNQTILWFSETFNIHPKKINAWVVSQKSEMLNSSGSSIGNTLSTVGGMLAAMLLTPVYIFMILFYQNHLVLFIHKLFGAGNDNKVSEVLTEKKKQLYKAIL